MAFDYPVEPVVPHPSTVDWPLDEYSQRLCRCGHPYGWHAHRGACGEILCQCGEYDPGDGSLEARDTKRAGFVMGDNDTDISGNTQSTNKEQCENQVDTIWALRLKYNKAADAISREILGINMLEALRHKGLGEDEIRRLMQVHGFDVN